MRRTPAHQDAVVGKSFQGVHDVYVVSTDLVQEPASVALHRFVAVFGDVLRQGAVANVAVRVAEGTRPTNVDVGGRGRVVALVDYPHGCPFSRAGAWCRTPMSPQSAPRGVTLI